MKKFLLLAMTALMALTASSQELPAHDGCTWYVRLGMSLNNATGGKMVKELNQASDLEHYSMGTLVGMAADFGFQYDITDFGIYWGMEFGVGNRGFSIKDEYMGEWEKSSMRIWSIKCAPLIIGYKYPISNDIKLDAHIGAYASSDIAGQKWKLSDSQGNKMDDDNTSDANLNDADVGVQAGIGIWFKRFNLDVTYQRGFIPMAKPNVTFMNSDFSFFNKSYNLYSSNVMVRLGVAF